MIECCKVKKSFKGKLVLDEIEMKMKPGNIYGIIGRNGSGKTVLMKCICGFLQPDAGKVVVNGKTIGKDVDFIENAGVIIETPGFIPYFTGYQNLKNLASIRKKVSKKEIEDTMEYVGLNPKNHTMVAKYSLGMRQRLGIAQAIMENPEVLILDEPMNGLDKEGVEDIRKLLLQLKEQGKVILMASHNAEDIELLCDHVWEMDKGVAVKVR
ncbi:MAG: ATP-binding cassette domain-containing protein [Lachnospiraceae bacterium]|nr:ATP-binding cassette domain-containing protein [Lachnospiraceae bacterium]